MNFKGAWQCDKCPKNGDPEKGRACPAWWEVMATDNLNGRMEVKKACAYLLMPTFLIEVIKASNRPAAAINEMTNSIVKQLEQMDKPNGQLTPLPGSPTVKHFLSSGE